MSVYLRRLKVLVTEEVLDIADVGAAFQQMGRGSAFGTYCLFIGSIMNTLITHPSLQGVVEELFYMFYIFL